jgi:predicted PurR-regulated permease PerM
LSSVSPVIKKHWRLLIFVSALVFIFCVLWLMRNVFLPFLVGFILAALFLPIINWVEKGLPVLSKKPKLRQFRRIIVIIIVFLLCLAFIVLVVFYAVTIIGTALIVITQESSQITTSGLNTIKNWLSTIPGLSTPSIQTQIEAYLLKAETSLPGVLNNFIINGLRTIQTSANMILGFIIMPVFMFFILKDWDKLRDNFFTALPQWASIHAKKIFNILHDVVIRYVRGQLLLGLAIGLCAYALLLILRIDYPLPLAVFAGLMEMVPMIGPWLGGGLAVVVTLATAPEKIIWVALGYVVIQLLENNFLVPKIQGSQMQIHPAFVIILSVIGAYFAGILGFIIILPLTMLIIRIFKYLWESSHNGSMS